MLAEISAPDEVEELSLLSPDEESSVKENGGGLPFGVEHFGGLFKAFGGLSAFGENSSLLINPSTSMFCCKTAISLFPSTVGRILVLVMFTAEYKLKSWLLISFQRREKVSYIKNLLSPGFFLVRFPATTAKLLPT